MRQVCSAMRPRMAADSAGRGGSLELMIRVNAGLGRGSSFANTVTLPEVWFGQAHPGQGVQNIVVLDFKSVGLEFEYEWHAYVGRCSREVMKDGNTFSVICVRR